MEKYFWKFQRGLWVTPAEISNFDGTLIAKYAMPDFRCCGTRVSDKFALIDFDLPREFRCNNEFRAKDYVDISYENFVEYQKQLLLHPDLPGLTENDLQRAVEFFPCDFTLNAPCLAA